MREVSAIELRELATAKEELERMETYVGGLKAETNIHATIQWDWGSSLDGYKAVRGRVERRANLLVHSFILDTVVEQKALVARLTAQVFGDAQ